MNIRITRRLYSLIPVAAIELDDKSHNQKHDELPKNICQQSQLPLLRVPAKYAYKTEVLRMILAKEFEGSVDAEQVVLGLKVERGLIRLILLLSHFFI